MIRSFRSLGSSSIREPLRLAGLAFLPALVAGIGITADPSAALAQTATPVAPPVITILKSSPRVAKGLVFLAPKITAPGVTGPQGPEIIDDQGRPIWFQPVASADEQVTDFRVQRYRGEPVLTYWTGSSHTGAGHGEGTDTILDRSYRVVATVNAGNGYSADSHEFHLTPEGTALITVYHQEPYDLSSVGGPADGQVFDGIVQEIDVATGKVLFEWHSLDHIALDESEVAAPTTSATAYDYFHVNGVNIDYDGNLIISARNAWAAYKVDRHTGDVIWRLGGKKSDFAQGPGATFAYQHNPTAAGLDTVRIFDNESTIGPSRVIWVHHDRRAGTASLLRSFEHPDALSAGSQGNSQALDNEDTFVGWGATGRVSEFDAWNHLLFDASVPTGYDTYRSYRFEWVGLPATAPSATVQANADGTATVHAVWNGATEVAHWFVLGGDRASALVPIAVTDWNGLDTSIAVKKTPKFVEIVATDRFGRPLGRSSAVATGG